MDSASFKQKLIAMREEIEALQAENAESAGTVVLDQQKVGRLSRMDALQTQAINKEAERRRKIKLQRIALALKQIEDEDYGYCVECDEAIAPARLDYDPTASTCIDCAAKLENSD